MTTLKERYIAAALERLPDDQRDEIGAEIRAAIGEMVDQRVEAGEPEEAATEQTLNELGDPAKLAASYQERPRYVIGPGWYPSYISAMKKIPAVVLPIVALITLLVGIGIDQKDLSDAIQGTVESVIGAAVQIVFWITLAFVIAERVIGPEMPTKRQGPWTVADLPEAPAKRQISLGDVLPDVIAMIAVVVLVLLQYARGIGYFVRGGVDPVKHLSLLNPDLAWGWQVGFFGVVAVSIVSPVVRYLRGYWTRPMFLLEFVGSALWIMYVVALAASEPIINPEFAGRVDEGATWWKTGGTANIVIALAVSAVSVQTAWEAWTGYREYRRVYEGDAEGRTAPATRGG